ncbi:hypothetical protein CLV59_110158 [Chitinophaga dinghuensis]|uniref:YD repeat-containing protein n=2 Tax=Chitinophaga dinghuensis TaxID=1539050 RepID=A0A327VKU1_9BACT|nr:hypothetical protein CLV59_110158 [Chitinophaga dinghuensis]
MLKMAAGAAMLALIMTSCGKKDDNTPSVQQYLPLTVVDNEIGQVVDSFVFKNNIIQSVYTDNAGNGNWRYYYNFVYGTDGRCKKVEYVNTQNNKVEYTDSVAYNNDKITMTSWSIDNPSKSTYEYAMKNNLAVLMGSKDSIIREGRKYVNYTEYTLTGGNLTTMNIVSGTSNLDGSGKSSYTYTYNYFYDNKPNGFQYAFEKNPFLYFYMVTYDEFLEVPRGAGNFTKRTFTANSNGNTSSNTFEAINTYNAETGFLQTQKLTDGDGAAWDFKYNFRKAD